MPLRQQIKTFACCAVLFVIALLQPQQREQVQQERDQSPLQNLLDDELGGTPQKANNKSSRNLPNYVNKNVPTSVMAVICAFIH